MAAPQLGRGPLHQLDESLDIYGMCLLAMLDTQHLTNRRLMPTAPFASLAALTLHHALWSQFKSCLLGAFALLYLVVVRIV